MIVTPFFQCWNLADRAFDCYAIEGGIGVIHQGFETAWSSRFAGDPSEQAVAVSLYTANFLELSRVIYIPYEGSFHEAVDAFCNAIVNILNALPSDEDRLFRAFETDNLYGKRVRTFNGSPYIGKFNAFEEYVNQRFRSS